MATNSFEQTLAQMTAAGVTPKITVLKSQFKRNRKSLYGVRPSMNKGGAAGCNVSPIATAMEKGRTYIAN